MKIRNHFLILLYSIGLTCYTSMIAQDPPPPGIPAPQKEEVDHTVANEKLAKEIQKTIDALNELKDADKIENLKKIKKHIEDNKKTEPGKNLEDAVKKIVKKGEVVPHWLDNLVRGWKKSLGILFESPDHGWQNLETDFRITRMILEPIIYKAGPGIDPHVHAYITYEVMPGNQIEYLNARLTDPSTGTSLWLVENVPLLPFDQPQIISYRINVEAFGPAYDFLQCEYYVGSTWQTDPQFPSIGSVDLIPQPTVYNIASGSSDPALQIGDLIAISMPPGTPKNITFMERGCDVYNEDLDNSKNYPDDNPIPNDINACGPAAAANSLHWLVEQHTELAGESTSLRSKVDSLKKYMNLCKNDTNGVRFDSMVVGKLTLIDKLKLPIRVKYKTKHVSGNVTDPLASTEPPAHTADNHGKLDVYPDFDWLKKEMDEGEDVELQVGWYGHTGIDGALERHGGHWVVVTGYFSSNMSKGISIKDDNDQDKAGGMRHEYFEWAPGETPYLIGMTDAKGNKAIVESVVSESYDPTVTFDDEVSNPITVPWSDITLTGERMKPGFPFLVSVEKSFPWLPVIAGVTGAGVATYFLTKDDKQECDFTATSQITATSCELPNGAITISVTPAGQYEYIWSNGSASNSIQNITAGNYSVTITRTGTECNLVLPVTVPNTNPSFNATITTQDAACGLQNGSAIVNVNPTGIYTYSWSTGASGQTQNNLAPGNYSVTVSAGGTCTEEVSLNIGELPPAFEATVTTTPSDCGQSNGTGVVNVNPAGTYTFEWSGGITGQQVTDLPPGGYTITVTLEGTQCSKTVTANVEELPPAFELTVTTTPSDCGQSNGTGAININPPGNYIVEWSPGITGQQVTDLPAGAYTITVTLEGTQCSKTITANVDELPPAFEVTVNTTPSDCGQSNGTGVVNINPPGNYIVEWSPGITGQQVTDLPAGAYTITVTLEGTHCSKTIMADVGELPPTFTITSSTSPSGCNDSTGTATVTVDPPGAYTITWSNGLTGSQVSGLAAGDYQVTVTITGTTCSNTATVVVGQSGVEFTGTISVDPASCGVADGSATITIDPAGEYTYVWSDQQTEPVAQQLSAGDYSVTVTDMNGCSSSFSATVGEDPAEYITIDNTMPGNCTGGGEINFTLTTPGMGPLVLEVVGPGGTGSFTLAAGSYSLSTFGNLPAGDYVLTVIDQIIGAICSEVVNVTIADNTPPLQAADDFYTTPGGQDLTANALNNDSGLMPEMTMVSNVFGGMVVFNSSGEFTFTPDPGFSGEASFTYTVTDACGDTATAVVTITVEEIICDFNLDVTTVPASCGFEDGSISVEVIEPGTYLFFWNTGDTGSVITNIPAGTYTVTVEEVNLGCSLVFSIDLSENPADYIDEIVVTQPDCGTDGEISFVASSPGMDPLIMSVDHPNGSDLFFIDEGPVFISDYVSITPGLYTIEVSDPGAGPDCVESFTVEIDQPPAMIEIAVEAVFPPSEPTAMDGSILIAVTVPGEFPYTVLLNGVPVSMVSENFFTISGLGVGSYTVQIIDAQGCESNIVEADVPFPGIIISFGSGIHNVAYMTDPEHTSTGPLWSSGIYSSLQYYIGNKSQELRFLYALPGDRNSGHDMSSDILVVDHFSEIIKTEWKKIQLTLQGGIGFTILPDNQTDLVIDPQHWIIRGNAKHKLGKILQLQCSASMQGWGKIERPVVEIGIQFSVCRPPTH